MSETSSPGFTGERDCSVCADALTLRRAGLRPTVALARALARRMVRQYRADAEAAEVAADIARLDASEARRMAGVWEGRYLEATRDR